MVGSAIVIRSQFQAEGIDMAQQTEERTEAGSGMGHAFGRAISALKIAVLVVSVAAAIPTARNLYVSWTQDIPFSEVSHRLTQYELVMKNISCKISYKPLVTAKGIRLDVGACPTSGDIAVMVTGPQGGQTYQWIDFAQLRKPGQVSAGLLDLVIGSAHAADLSRPGDGARPLASFKVAQASLEVMCQARKGNQVVRIIKQGGKCYRELLSPLRGTVDKREEVACTTTCG